jgi:hypothetical protein
MCANGCRCRADQASVLHPGNTYLTIPAGLVQPFFISADSVSDSPAVLLWALGHLPVAGGWLLHSFQPQTLGLPVVVFMMVFISADTGPLVYISISADTTRHPASWCSRLSRHWASPGTSSSCSSQQTMLGLLLHLPVFISADTAWPPCARLS